MSKHSHKNRYGHLAKSVTSPSKASTASPYSHLANSNSSATSAEKKANPYQHLSSPRSRPHPQPSPRSKPHPQSQTQTPQSNLQPPSAFSFSLDAGSPRKAEMERPAVSTGLPSPRNSVSVGGMHFQSMAASSPESKRRDNGMSLTSAVIETEKLDALHKQHERSLGFNDYSASKFTEKLSGQPTTKTSISGSSWVTKSKTGPLPAYLKRLINMQGHAWKNTSDQLLELHCTSVPEENEEGLAGGEPRSTLADALVGENVVREALRRLVQRLSLQTARTLADLHHVGLLQMDWEKSADLDASDPRHRDGDDARVRADREQLERDMPVGTESYSRLSMQQVARLRRFLLMQPSAMYDLMRQRGLGERLASTLQHARLRGSRGPDLLQTLSLMAELVSPSSVPDLLLRKSSRLVDELAKCTVHSSLLVATHSFDLLALCCYASPDDRKMILNHSQFLTSEEPNAKPEEEESIQKNRQKGKRDTLQGQISLALEFGVPMLQVSAVGLINAMVLPFAGLHMRVQTRDYFGGLGLSKLLDGLHKKHMNMAPDDERELQDERERMDNAFFLEMLFKEVTTFEVQYLEDKNASSRQGVDLLDPRDLFKALQISGIQNKTSPHLLAIMQMLFALPENDPSIWIRSRAILSLGLGLAGGKSGEPLTLEQLHFLLKRKKQQEHEAREGKVRQAKASARRATKRYVLAKVMELYHQKRAKKMMQRLADSIKEHEANLNDVKTSIAVLKRRLRENGLDDSDTVEPGRSEEILKLERELVQARAQAIMLGWDGGAQGQGLAGQRTDKNGDGNGTRKGGSAGDGLGKGGSAGDGLGKGGSAGNGLGKGGSAGNGIGKGVSAVDGLGKGGSAGDLGKGGSAGDGLGKGGSAGDGLGSADAKRLEQGVSAVDGLGKGGSAGDGLGKGGSAGDGLGKGGSAGDGLGSADAAKRLEQALNRVKMLEEKLKKAGVTVEPKRNLPLIPGSPIVATVSLPLLPAAPSLPLPTGAPPPPAPPPPPLLADEPAPPLKERQPRKKMKAFHWSKIDFRSSKETVWHELLPFYNDWEAATAKAPQGVEEDNASSVPTLVKKLSANSLEWNYDEIEECFHDEKKETKKTTSEKKLALAVLDQKKAFTLNVIIKSFKVPAEDIYGALYAMNTQKLPADMVASMFSAIPDINDIKAVEAAEETYGMSRLGAAEQFVLILSKVPDLKSRLRTLHLMHHFSTDATELRNKLDTVKAATKALRTSASLSAALSLVWRMGNFLNHGSSKGRAYGLKLSSLRLLPGLKGNDRKHSLMDALVVRMQQLHLADERVALAADDSFLFPPTAEVMVATPSLLQELEMIPLAARIERDMFLKDAQTLFSEIQQAKDFLNRVNAQAPDEDPRNKLIPVLQQFLKKNQGEAQAIAAGINELTDTMTQLQKWFKDDQSSTWEDFFGLFVSFMKDFAVSWENLKQEARKLENEVSKQRTRELLKTLAHGKHQEQHRNPASTAEADKESLRKEKLLREQMHSQPVPLDVLKERSAVNSYQKKDAVGKAAHMFKELGLRAKVLKAAKQLEDLKQTLKGSVEEPGREPIFTDSQQYDVLSEQLFNLEHQLYLSRKVRGIQRESPKLNI